MHELTKENIERMNAKYKLAGDKGRKHVVVAPGDLVWLHLRMDIFPDLCKSKIMPHADGPFKVLEKINDNAQKLELPIDLLPLRSSEKVNFDAKARDELISKMHELTKENIERMNAKYKLAGDKGRIYLTWELETEQRFTCLQYPEERRVAAAVCAFTSFASRIVAMSFCEPRSCS